MGVNALHPNDAAHITTHIHCPAASSTHSCKVAGYIWINELPLPSCWSSGLPARLRPWRRRGQPPPLLLAQLAQVHRGPVGDPHEAALPVGCQPLREPGRRPELASLQARLVPHDRSLASPAFELPPNYPLNSASQTATLSISTHFKWIFQDLRLVSNLDGSLHFHLFSLFFWASHLCSCTPQLPQFSV